MTQKKLFYRCNICGNIIEKIQDSDVNVVCCNQEMELLEPNTSDGAKEKHLPEISVDGNKINVKVGSIPHPMTKEHHISWIVLANEYTTTRINLKDEQSPEVIFETSEDGNYTIYSYCNLHGLWMIDIKK